MYRKSKQKVSKNLRTQSESRKSQTDHWDTVMQHASSPPVFFASFVDEKRFEDKSVHIVYFLPNVAQTHAAQVGIYQGVAFALAGWTKPGGSNGVALLKGRWVEGYTRVEDEAAMEAYFASIELSTSSTLFRDAHTVTNRPFLNAAIVDATSAEFDRFALREQPYPLEKLYKRVHQILSGRAGEQGSSVSGWTFELVDNTEIYEEGEEIPPYLTVLKHIAEEMMVSDFVLTPAKRRAFRQRYLVFEAEIPPEDLQILFENPRAWYESHFGPAPDATTNFAPPPGMKAVQFAGWFLHIPQLTDVAMNLTTRLQVNFGMDKAVVLEVNVNRFVQYYGLTDISLWLFSASTLFYVVYPLYSHTEYKAAARTTRAELEDMAAFLDNYVQAQRSLAEMILQLGFKSEDIVQNWLALGLEEQKKLLGTE